MSPPSRSPIPYRVVVDLPQNRLQIAAQAAEQSRGLVKAFRYGLIMQGGSRIVLDTKGPVRVEKAFVLAATATSRRGWWSIFPPPTANSFDRAGLARDARAAQPAGQAKRRRQTGRRYAAADRARSGPWRPSITVAKRRAVSFEKDVVLQFAQTLRARLEAGGKYQVAMTRSEDTS